MAFNASNYLFLGFRDPSKPSFAFTVIGSYGLVCNQYDILVELQVKNGLIQGTSIEISDLFRCGFSADKSGVDRDDVASTTLLFKGLRNNQEFFKSMQDPSLIICSQAGIHNFFMNLDCVTIEWRSLCCCVSFGNRLRSGLRVAYHEPIGSENDDPNNGRKKIIVSVNQGFLTRTASLAIESLDIVKNLDLEDQIIVLKESVYPVCFLLVCHSFDKETGSFVNTAFDDEVVFCVNKIVLSSEKYAEPMRQFFAAFLDNFYEFLRTDFFVITLMCLLSVLKGRPGLTSEENLNKERKISLQLLEKYIHGKISSNHWPSEFELIWDHIMNWINQLDNIMSIYSRFAKAQEGIAC
jgi:hypothetical protein